MSLLAVTQAAMRMILLGLALGMGVLVAVPSHVVRADSTPIALDFKFQLVARNVWGVTGSGIYVGYTRPYVRSPAQWFVLLDDRTSSRVAVKWPRCGGDGRIGFPWVGFDCGSEHGARFRFYNMQTRKWRFIPCDASCQQFYYFIDLRRVGAKWFELSVAPHEPCGDGVHNSCGPTRYLYYNIATGKQGFPRTDAHTMIDLNSPTLTRQICAPLPVPSRSDSTSPPMLFGFYGRFALVEEVSGAYLERCGSQLHMPLVEGRYWAAVLFGNTQAVAQCPTSVGQTPSGIFLPSLLRFTFTLPRAVDCMAAVLGPRHLYVLDTARQMLWVASLPPHLRLTALKLSPRRFRAARSGPSVVPAAKTGTLVTFTLNEPARVRFTVARSVPGRRENGHCQLRTRANHNASACILFVAVRGSFTLTGNPGTNRYWFTGGIAGRRLAPGSYRLVATARDTNGNTASPLTTRFTILDQSGSEARTVRWAP